MVTGTSKEASPAALPVSTRRRVIGSSSTCFMTLHLERTDKGVAQRKAILRKRMQQRPSAAKLDVQNFRRESVAPMFVKPSCYRSQRAIIVLASATSICSV